MKRWLRNVRGRVFSRIEQVLTELLNFSILENMNTILKINDRGTLTLPKPLRKALGVSNGGVLMCNFRESTVMLQAAVTYPVRMYTDKEIAEFDAADAALGDKMDKYLEERGLVYDPVTWTIREKDTLGTKILREKGTPYMRGKKQVRHTKRTAQE